MLSTAYCNIFRESKLHIMFEKKYQKSRTDEVAWKLIVYTPTENISPNLRIFPINKNLYGRR